MSETKYFIISDKKLINKLFIILPLVVLGLLIISSIAFGSLAWLFVFLPILVIFLIVLGIQYIIFKASQGTYITLTDSEIRIHRTLGRIPPYVSVKYEKIKSITVDGDALQSMDTGAMTPYPVYAKLEKGSTFFDDFAKLYKKNIGKSLSVKN